MREAVRILVDRVTSFEALMEARFDQLDSELSQKGDKYRPVSP